MSKPNSVTDYVYLAMSNGQWWTFWELQDVIKRNEYQEDKSWIHQQQDSRHNQW